MKKNIVWAVVFVLFGCGEALASTTYEFCVNRSNGGGNEVLHVKYSFDGFDLGTEAARVSVASIYTKADTKSVQVSDFKPEICGNVATYDETQTHLSIDDMKRLVAQLGSGNPIAVATAAKTVLDATKIAVHALEKPTEKAGTAVHKACNKVKRLVSKHPC